jgi:lysozyme
VAVNDALLLRELVRDEALRTKPYRCTAGKLTIGIGRNLDDVGITEEEAVFLARNDIAKVGAQLDAALPWWRDLDDVRQRVLANMAFNLGTAGLLGFRNTLELIRTRRYLEASQAMLASKWARQVGIGTEAKPGRALRLALMMRDGKVPLEGIVP